ncbi:MAG: thioredoxin fold domain-containing protein [Proteobacteria bacterium]|nr:thioredoxin fold domain-containing protein [Pseudomonadota bacterium]
MASEKIFNVDDSTFVKEVEQAATPVLVDFGATWCGPCKALGATLDGMVDNYKDKIKFCYMDIQKAPMTAQKFAVRSVPTLILFKSGAPKGSLLGAQPKAKIQALISEVL